MKKIISSTIGLVLLMIITHNVVFAQGMMRNATAGSDRHTGREEAEGKAVWEKLQAKKLACKDLSADNFETLGEYFMGTMTGISHEAMNGMIIQMMGKKGEEQMHVVMGKRLSGCDTSAVFPSHRVGFLSMLPMMDFGFTPLGGYGWFLMILWWGLVIAGIVQLINWLTGQSHRANDHQRSPLEILKERYAKGEIDRNEFENKKKDLT
ncbi:SHOCT domain-containing protein [Candidatus Roizmanbacteria bacterium]|nr:SHOCT domain-containing protein [Candidatus Roizmanbacteria bacterium]